nr:interleukin-13 receptor subunit alpha-1 isoform X2 [Anser cygnoides]
MDPAGPFGAALRGRLLLAVCWAVTAVAAAGAKVLPPPSNLNYSFVQICTLNWTWNPPENISSSCDLEYSSDIVIDEVPQDQRWSKSLFRVTDTFLNEEMRFKVRSECKHDNASEPSRWVETSVLPKGIPGTAAVGLNCVWHNLEYMVCKWHPGENASSDTNYTLFYWFDGLKNPKKCKNYSMSQGSFECTFGLTFPRFTNTYPAISILIRDDSEEIRPVCASKNPTTLVKPATPKIVEVSYVNGGIYLQWSESDTFPANCLYYELRYHNGDLTVAQTIRVTSNRTSIPSVDFNSKYTFQVRAQPKPECYSSKLCSEWSEEKSIGVNPDSTFYFVLIVTIPLIVAVSTIVLLVYLKRLKILILPPIPDPREILKRMFGEQNDNPQSCAKDDSMNAYDRLIKEEEIHSLILTETPESSNSEKENRQTLLSQ